MGSQDGRALGSASERFPAARQKEGATECGVLGCPKRTSEDKPFCINHLDQIPYVRGLLSDMDGMTDDEIMGPVEPPEPKERRREVVPVEVQVGRARFWVGLVRARGVEAEPAAVEPQNPRRLRPELHVRLRPFTRLLTRDQSRHVLICLQEHRAGRIPASWFVDDQKKVDEVLRFFSGKG